MDNKNILIIPLWLLYGVESLNDVKLDDVLANNLKEYTVDDRRYLHSVIKNTNQSFDFHSLIENFPNRAKLNFTNEEIYNYLLEFKSFLENENYNLLVEK